MMLAFLLFFLIVGAECFLMVYLPWHVRLDGVWAKQVAQQEVIEFFDRVRAHSRHLSVKLPKPAATEAALICRSLDRIAGYMHKDGKKMSPAQCRELTDILVKFNNQFSVMHQGACSQVIELDESKYIKGLRGVKVQRKTQR